MTSFTHFVTAAEVTDATTFADYAQQTLGTPLPYGKELPVLLKKVKEFFAAYPQANWTTVARTVDYCRAKRRRPACTWAVLGQVKWAWADGFLPELDPRPRVNRNVEYAIAQALEVETDPSWRARLLMSCGVENRRVALGDWRAR